MVVMVIVMRGWWVVIVMVVYDDRLVDCSGRFDDGGVAVASR